MDRVCKTVSFLFRDIKFGEVLGTGAFGKVVRGVWTPPGGRQQEVAVKLLYGDVLFSLVGTKTATVEVLLAAFISELLAMARVQHKNLGICLGASIRFPNVAIVVSEKGLGVCLGWLHLPKWLEIFYTTVGPTGAILQVTTLKGRSFNKVGSIQCSAHKI